MSAAAPQPSSPGPSAAETAPIWNAVPTPPVGLTLAGEGPEPGEPISDFDELVDDLLEDLPLLDTAPTWTDVEDLIGGLSNAVPNGLPSLPQPPDLDAILDEMFGDGQGGAPIDLGALTDQVLESLPTPATGGWQDVGSLDELIAAPDGLIELPALPELGELLAGTPFGEDGAEANPDLPDLDDILPALPGGVLTDIFQDDEDGGTAGSLLGGLDELPDLPGLPATPSLGALLGDNDDTGPGLDLGDFGWG